MATSRPQATILVVDDEAAIRMLASQALQNRGYQVLVAANGAEAIQMADAYPSAIHLLVTDIMMPSGNGIALAKAMLAKRPYMPVLYMSGFQTETIRLVQEDGGPEGGFLAKPFSPRVLLERVEEMIPTPETITAAPIQTQTPVRTQDSEAVYRLETAVKCPYCKDEISTLKAVRLLRMQVNFTSTLPRRGRVAVCPSCQAIIPVELTNF